MATVSLVNPVIVPAVPEQQFPDVRYLDIRIHKTAPGEPGEALVAWAPWNEGTNEFLPGAVQHFRVENIVAKASVANSNMQMAWHFLVLALNEEQATAGIALPPA